MVSSVDPAAATAGRPSLLLGGSYAAAQQYGVTRSDDLTPDGERFLMLKRPPVEARRRVNVVTNWLAEWRERAPR